MRDLQERATDDFERTLPLIRAAWSEVADEIEAERVGVEREAADLHAAGKYDAGAKVLSEFMETNVERMLQTSRRLIDAI